MCDPIVVDLLKMLPHYIVNLVVKMRAIPSSGTSPLASYKELSHQGHDRTRIFHILISLSYHNTTMPIHQNPKNLSS